MKSIIIFFTFILAINIHSQESNNTIRCVVSNQYIILTNSGEIYKKGNCSVCFDNNYCSFFFPELGSRSFEIDKQSVFKIDMNEFFGNSEKNSNISNNDIVVNVNYGINEKTILINYTKFGNTYVCRSEKFVGSKSKTSLNNNDQVNVTKSLVKIDSTEIKRKQKIDSLKLVYKKDVDFDFISEEGFVKKANFKGGKEALAKLIKDSIIDKIDTLDFKFYTDRLIKISCLLQFNINDYLKPDYVRISNFRCQNCNNVGVDDIKLEKVFENWIIQKVSKLPFPEWEKAKINGETATLNGINKFKDEDNYKLNNLSYQSIEITKEFNQK